VSGGIGPFEGVHEEKAGVVTVFCDAESHELWERTYSRLGDTAWAPEPFDHIGGERGEMRISRRGGGIQFIDAAGRVIRSWDFGRAGSVDDPLGVDDPHGDGPRIDRARKVTGLSDDAHLPVGRRYLIRCPLCGDAIRRSDTQAQKQFNQLWEQGIPRISLNSLRKLDRLL
jgi:hypothetical protein